MPIYEYRCKKCKTKFEVFQHVGASNDSVNCPECNEPKPEKIFSIFGSVNSNSGSSTGCSTSSPFS